LEEVFPAPGLPDEVSDLYAPSIELAKAGQWAKAAEAAEKVSHDDVRSAYAQALVDVASGRSAFSGVPSEGQMEAMAASIGEGGGKWGEHFRDLLRLPVSDQYAKSRVMGAVDSLGKALHKTPDVERDLDESDIDERADAPASKQDREAVAFTRKEWEKKLDSARAKARASRDYVAPEERGAALLRDRVQKEAETVAPPTVRPPIRQAPPVSAAKPPPAALDYAELFSASATPTDELDYDLDELMGRAPAGAKR
jgi:hypothetical protein